MKIEVYRSRPIKARRTRAEIEALKAELYAVVEENQPMTVRQVFYQMVTRSLIEKTEAQYKNTVVRLLGKMREAGELPFAWITDNTRWQRKPRTYSSLEEALWHTARYYRRAVWDSQEAHVEFWLEKDALSGVIYEVTEPWDVPLYVSRGFSSTTLVNGAAEEIREANKPAYIYCFGDCDPSAMEIPRDIERKIRRYAPDAEVHFTRVAVTPEQIISLGLPTRPTKKTDSRVGKFGTGRSVELDAIPPGILREMAAKCIEQHVDQQALWRTKLIEKEERKILELFAGSDIGLSEDGKLVVEQNE